MRNARPPIPKPVEATRGETGSEASGGDDWCISKEDIYIVTY